MNEYWTVAGVLGHLAYWDLRFQTLAEKIDRGEPWVAGDQEPDGDWLNDSMRPLIHALAPRRPRSSRCGPRRRPTLAPPCFHSTDSGPGDPDSPISPARGEHRGEHLDEIEAVLRSRG